MVVPVIDDEQISVGGEGQTVRANEQFAGGKWLCRAVAGDLQYGIPTAAGDENVARRLAHGNADGALQAARDDGADVTEAIDPGERASVAARLQQAAVLVDGIAG